MIQIDALLRVSMTEVVIFQPNKKNWKFLLILEMN